MAGGLNRCFHNKLGFPARLFSVLGLVPRRPAMKSLTVYNLKFKLLLGTEN